MKFWVMLICLLSNKIERETEMIDKKIMELALDPFADSLKQCEKIASLSNEKITLINLKILFDRIQREIGKEGVDKIMLLRSKPFLRQYCDRNDKDIKAVVAEALAIAKKGVVALEKLSFTQQKLDEDFGDNYRIVYELQRVKSLIKYYSRTILETKKRDTQDCAFSLCG